MSHKPRILFVMHYLEIGGAETALIGLLNTIDYSRYDVDLFLHSHQGEMMSFVPKEVNLLPEIPIYAQIERPIKNVLKDGYWRMVAARLKAKMRTRRYISKHHVVKETSIGLQYTAAAISPLLPAINPSVEYNLAISFLLPHIIVRDKVRARKKACWIHTDYSAVHVNTEVELPVWSAFDYVVSISNDVTKSFLQTFPTLESKIVLIENILSPTFVRQRAEEFDAMPELQKDKLKLLSVGRFLKPKNYDNLPDICRRMVEICDVDFRWFIIGYGHDEPFIRTKIAEAGMEDHVIILGKRSNPYPYIKACDIYIQPSRYEGKSVTVREAQMLYKPVVVTNYPTAPSQIKDGHDGVIVPMDNQGCAEGIINLMRDKAKQEEITAYLKTHDYGNEKEVEKLYEML